MNIETWLQLLATSQRSLEMNLDGLVHEDSTAQPPAGNCVNWLLGHILLHRNRMLDALGHPPAWMSAAAARYDRGTAPIVEPENVARLESLLGALRHTYDVLVEALASGPPAAPAGEDGSAVERRITQLLFHEAYHAGQVGTVRRLIGKPAAIR